MPFGLTNAPASYQRMINDQYPDVFVVAYLDDILIFSKNETEHIEHIKKVLQKSKKADLLLKPEKCEFHKEEVKFLGYFIGKNGVRMDPSKVEAEYFDLGVVDSNDGMIIREKTINTYHKIYIYFPN